MTQIAAGIEATFHPHDPLWGAISFVLAVCAAYVSLELADRIRVSAGLARQRWLAATVAMGGRHPTPNSRKPCARPWPRRHRR